MSSTFKKTVVLVIDDDETNVIMFQRAMATILRLSGLAHDSYTLHSAMNARVGREMVNLVFPDIVICDFQMPGDNGLELLEALRREPSALDFIFILATTSPEQVQNDPRLEFTDGLFIKPSGGRPTEAEWQPLADIIKAGIAKRATEL